MKMDERMGENVKKQSKRCGRNVRIYPLAKIVKSELIEIGDYSHIDDFSFFNGGKGLNTGKYVHIASFVSIPS